MKLDEVAEQTVRTQQSPDRMEWRVVALTVPGMAVPAWDEPLGDAVELYRGPSELEAGIVSAACRRMMVLALRSLDEVRRIERGRCVQVALQHLGKIRGAGEIAQAIEQSGRKLLVLPGGEAIAVRGTGVGERPAVEP